MKALYSVIAIETIAIILLCYFLFKAPAPIEPVNYFNKEYDRKIALQDSIISAQADIIERSDKRRVQRDTIRTIKYIKAHEAHNQVNLFNDSTRNNFWDSTFFAKGI